MERDIGRAVVYTGKSLSLRQPRGVITSFSDHSVFVCFGADKYSKGTSRADLKWCGLNTQAQTR